MKNLLLFIMIFSAEAIFSQQLVLQDNSNMQIEAPTLVEVASSSIDAEYSYIHANIKKTAENLDIIKNVLIDCEVKRIRVNEFYQGKPVALDFNLWIVELEKQRRLKKLFTSEEYKNYKQYRKNLSIK